ncbi:hypothetical protein OSB04_018852 [Centaurea solstitialis]|uniref:Integrase catalytic domain-containing protein n=1 Tax=Centaurea solstitialis TaxID=347529 RepID=A0AA38SQT0_9ASTR|nr:hypothetical protein OSB04_018852 [Centaurea solstitialis]
MAGGAGKEPKGSESVISKLDFGDPLYLHPSDTSGTPILNFKLSGTENYKVWSCAMSLALETKNKLGFVDGTCVKPTDNEVLAKQWDRCNSVVLSWILGSVVEELFLGQVFSKVASTVWSELKETYDKVDGSVTFNLYQKINSITQAGGSVSDYYHKLNAYWRQFDALVKLPNCTCNASVEFSKHTQLIKLMQFLMGLDDVYLPIRSSILTTEPLPSVKTAFSLVSREESHRVVPEFDVNLLSVHKLARDNKLSVRFDEDMCEIQDLTQKKIVGTGSEHGGLYLLNVPRGEYEKVNQVSICCVSKLLWHSRLGHPAEPVMNILKDKLQFYSNKVPPCEICHQAKQSRNKFETSIHRTTCLGEIVHLDVRGPYKVSTKEGFKFFLTIVDDFTRSVWVYLLKGKDEVFDCIVNFFNMLQTQFHKTVKIFRSDNGTEFVNTKFKTFINEKGLIHQTSCTYTPQQNGVVERKHRHLLNVARALMFQSGIPLYMWHECVLTATYLINRTPSSVLNGKSPYELMYGFAPVLDHLRNFGCLSFAMVPNVSDKFSSRSEKCVFLGYCNSKKGYKLYSLDTKQILISRDVKFYENIFPFKMRDEGEGTSSLNDFHILKFFETFEHTDNIFNGAPNDDIRGRSPIENTRDSSTPVSIERQPRAANNPPLSSNELSSTEQVDVDTISSITSGFNEQGDHSPEGNFQNTNTNSVCRRSDRVSRVPRKFDDYIIEGKVKYGIEKVVNYSQLNKENFCFVSNLNK